ncbi:IclR family transcriptional regulator [Prauserella cavernicola]|uniref:IclR family transcriptional regulator n=1 Tax=Prauserella cavernicola TaxID=2800127 RepID=A0A934QWA4_9PSEU|nr:IclR family transcriptional regulator [Prauserella cavernicola]MBK1787593.1 IclR family transcriptional regulator [Prauserella cavernicola]
MENRPVYGINSVDHALRLATILQQEGPLRVSEAAERLGVARSTAHRLLTMLVYRDFAARDAQRRYVAGPVLHTPAVPEPVAELRQVALPHLHDLTERTAETSHLGVLVADRVRFVASVECDQVLRVGDREGRVLPAHLASLGRAALATLEPDAVRARYGEPAPADVDLDQLLRDLGRVRRQGYALNQQLTETGLTAIGCAVDTGSGALRVGLSLAMPTARYRRDRVGEWTRSITATAAAISRDLHLNAGLAG